MTKSNQEVLFHMPPWQRNSSSKDDHYEVSSQWLFHFHEEYQNDWS